MNFLIVTEPDDVHAMYVTLALQSYGHQVVNLFSGDFPTKQKNSVFIDQQVYRCQTTGSKDCVFHGGYDVVWWRRPRKPIFASAEVHPEDLKFHKRESLMFHENFSYQLAPGAWWVNRKEAALRASYKLLQLRMASEVGLRIPSTLCSNDHAEIVRFYQSFQHQGVIYKPLSYQVWREASGYKMFYTSKLEESSLLESSNCQLYPGIYQQQIPKKYELRVTCFGDFIVAAKLDSQKYPEGQIDWRALNKTQIDVEPYHLPERLKQQIRFLMREMGLVFGALDFIVTPNDEFVFLEINEQGQFLFLENRCEDLPMLDIFVHFLMQQSIDFHWIKRHNLLRMSHFTWHVDKLLQLN
jgi:glutathione synthase/RimK-type ligase-like ATP-grasp enzyme